MNNNQPKEPFESEKILCRTISDHIKNNNLKEIKDILSYYSYADHIMNKRGNYAVTYDLFEESCLSGNIEIVKLFLNKRSPKCSYSLHKNHTNSHTGINGLMLAVQSGNEELVDYFLTYFDVNKLTHDGNNMLLFAAMGNNIPMFDKMMKLGLNPLQLDKNNHNLIQHMDFKRNDLYPMLDKLISLGVDINNIGNKKRYPNAIFKAASYRNTGLVTYFMKNNADLSIVNQDNKDLLENVLHSIYNYGDYNTDTLSIVLEHPHFKNIRMIDEEFYYNNKQLNLNMYALVEQKERIKKFIHFKIIENLTEKPEYKNEKRIKI